MSGFFFDESEELHNQYCLNQLCEKRWSWEKFLAEGKDLLSFSRLASSAKQRTLLHLAVLDNRIDVLEKLQRDDNLKMKRDHYGLSALELAQFLDRRECLPFLQPPLDLSSGEETRPLSLKSFKAELRQGGELVPFGGFEYLPYPIFENQKSFESVLQQAAKMKREDKIPPEKIWMGIYFDKELRKGTHPPVSIRFVDEEVGYGVFAEKKIAACTYVGEYTGIIQERKPKELKEKRYCLRYAIWESKKNFIIDAENKGNFTRFINHSSKPNLCLQSIYWRGLPRMIFVALKEIREGGQLTFDYGPLFWKEYAKSQKSFDDH